MAVAGIFHTGITVSDLDRLAPASGVASSASWSVC